MMCGCTHMRQPRFILEADGELSLFCINLCLDLQVMNGNGRFASKFTFFTRETPSLFTLNE